MNRITHFLCVIFLLSGLKVQSQSLPSELVERELVIVEIGTGTWCSYCPGAALGADDLVGFGHKVAIIEYHNGDNYSNTSSNERNLYNGVSIFPTAVFDGMEKVVGGHHTQSMYPSYLPEYNSRITIMTGYSMNMVFSNSGNEYTVTVQVQKHDPDASHTQLKLRLALTESHIQQNWQGQTELNFVERLMIPDHEGTPVDFSGNNIQEYTFNFTLDPSWNNEHCVLISFLQTDTNKEILQGTKKSLAQALYTYDVSAQEIVSPERPVCGDSLHTVMIIKNNGAENLTTLDIYYHINGDDENIYNWTGNLAFPNVATIELPGVFFDNQDTNQVVLICGNPNGFPDENLINNQITGQFLSAQVVISQTVHLNLKTDNYGYETSWKLFDAAGSVIYEGSGYANNQIYSFEFDLELLGCYEFVIYDSFGDGICSGSGNGFYKLIDNLGHLIGNGCDFGAEEHTDFSRGVEVGIFDNVDDPLVKIFPNPFKNSTILSLLLEKEQFVVIKVSTMNGKLLFTPVQSVFRQGTHPVELDMSGYAPGIYLVTVQTGNKLNKLKIIHY